MLINKGMKRTDLLKVAGINSSALAKMGKNLPVTMEALGKICNALQCNIEDIVEFLPDEEVASKPFVDWTAEQQFYIIVAKILERLDAYC